MRKTYLYETHMHTREGSACATATGQEMVRAHIKAGYAGMIVTDHFFNGNTAIPKDLPWDVRVDLFCRGYEHALEEAKGTDFHVFFAWEYTYHGTDFLTYGLDKDFLLKHPDILEWSPEEYFDIVHENGGFIVHAHPFREAFYIDKIRLFPEYIDAVEVINASHLDPIFDERALRFAQENSLLQTAGSDLHHWQDICGAGMAFEYEIKSMEDFIKSVKGEDYTLVKGFSERINSEQ
ncbi:MAG: PHP domain-containing protein [Caldicoprobacterales bacterium]